MFNNPKDIMNYMWLISFKDPLYKSSVDIKLSLGDQVILLRFTKKEKKSVKYINRLINDSYSIKNSFFNEEITVSNDRVFKKNILDDVETKYVVDFLIDVNGVKYVLFSLEDIKLKDGSWYCILNTSQYYTNLDENESESEIGTYLLDELVKISHKIAYYLHIDFVYTIDSEKENDIFGHLIKEISGKSTDYVKLGYIPLNLELYNMLKEKINVLKNFVVENEDGDENMTLEEICKKYEDVYTYDEILEIFFYIQENIEVGYVYYDAIVYYRLNSILYCKKICLYDVE